jgi:hypothetical protein
MELSLRLLLVELCVVFGMAGLFWPERLVALFDVLMFPWAASHRTVRAHGVAALGAALILFAVILRG